MVIHELAAALAHAHEAGVIHRDLKPENVMVREDGVLKLMDFGIAKLLDPDERMTVTGALVGSPAHMAPEIIEGQEAGPEADVFSLGTMLYCLVTGPLPFAAPNTTATLKRILDGTYEDPRRRVPAPLRRAGGHHRHLPRARAGGPLRERAASCAMRSPTTWTGLGLARVGEELASFFADPRCYQHRARPAARRDPAARARRSRPPPAGTPRALAGLNQVLALERRTPAARALLDRLQTEPAPRTGPRRGGRSRRRVGRRRRRCSAGATALVRSRTRSPEAAEPTLGALSSAPSAAATRRAPPTRPAARSPGRQRRSPPASRAPAARPRRRASRRGHSSPDRDRRSTRGPVPLDPRRPTAGGGVATRSWCAPTAASPVDGEAPSSEPLGSTASSWPPGGTASRVSCEWCEDVRRRPSRSVAGSPRRLPPARPAQARRAALRLRARRGSRCRVGDVSRTAARDPGASPSTSARRAAPPASSTGWSTR